MCKKYVTVGILLLFIGVNNVLSTDNDQEIAAPSSNDMYQVANKKDTTPPVIVINFAANLSDRGGPFWRPSGETIPLTGIWGNGYYTNDSCQASR